MTAPKAKDELLKVRWMADEDEVLRREWPSYATVESIVAKLPGRTLSAAKWRAYELDLKRPMVPLVRGGTHSFDNLVPSCKSCNSRKGSLLPADWDQKLYGGK